MRRLPALALLSVLLTAAPAFAPGIGEAGDSDQQTTAYGTFFAYVIGAVGSIVVILLITHQVRTLREEARRGTKVGRELVEILDADKPKNKKRKDLYLGEKVPEWKASNRRLATEAALRLLARADDGFTLKRLTDVVQKVVPAAKAAVEVRSTKAIEPKVTPACLQKLKEEIKGLRDKGERHVFGKLEVEEVEVVHVEAPAEEEKHTFTALVSVKSQDYYADEKTGKRLRGDKEKYSYQEFWQFRRVGGKWLLDRVRSSSDMDRVLNAKNILTRDDLNVLAKKLEPKHLPEFAAEQSGPV